MTGLLERGTLRRGGEKPEGEPEKGKAGWGEGYWGRSDESTKRALPDGHRSGEDEVAEVVVDEDRRRERYV